MLSTQAGLTYNICRRSPVSGRLRAEPFTEDLPRDIDVKTFFCVFFTLVTFFTFLDVFYFPNVFYLKNVGKVQSGKQINKKHFQNNSSEIDL